MSTSRMWLIAANSFSAYPTLYTQETDPFGKEGDIVDYGESDYYTSYELPSGEIPVAEQDRLHDLFPNGLSQDPSGREIKKRLARLAPDSKTADWTKLTGNSSSEAQYNAGLAERLIVIACAKAGEGHVVRGLIRIGRLCPLQK